MLVRERKALLVAKLRLKAGDRSGCLEILDELAPRSLPLPLDPNGRFACIRLDCEGLPYRTCVARQVANDVQRTKQKDRGQGSTFPLCYTATCDQGRRIRQALENSERIDWRGSGFGGRFWKLKIGREVKAQLAAKLRARRQGLLAEVRTLDDEPEEAEP